MTTKEKRNNMLSKSIFEQPMGW